MKEELIELVKNPEIRDKFVTFYNKKHKTNLNDVILDDTLLNYALLEFINDVYGIHIAYTINSYFIYYLMQTDHNRLKSFVIHNTDVIAFIKYDHPRLLSTTLTDALICVLKLIIKPF
jgi:hypothetical protein